MFNVALVLPGVCNGSFFFGSHICIDSFGLCMRWMEKPVPDYAGEWSAACVLVLSN